MPPELNCSVPSSEAKIIIVTKKKKKTQTVSLTLISHDLLCGKDQRCTDGNRQAKKKKDF